LREPTQICDKNIPNLFRYLLKQLVNPKSDSMARQVAPYIVGTFNGICYYKMNGAYFMRRCPYVNKRKRKEAPSYERQRRWNEHFRECSKLSRSLYRQLPRDKRKAGLQQKGTGLAIRLTKEGRDLTYIEQALMKLMGLKQIEKRQQITCNQHIKGEEVVLAKRDYLRLAFVEADGGWKYKAKPHGHSHYIRRVMDEEAMEKTMRGEHSMVEGYPIPLTPSLVASRESAQAVATIDPIIRENLFVPTTWPPYTLPPLSLQKQINELLHRKVPFPDLKEAETDRKHAKCSRHPFIITGRNHCNNEKAIQ
jgi:hypothetical protein